MHKPPSTQKKPHHSEVNELLVDAFFLCLDFFVGFSWTISYLLELSLVPDSSVNAFNSLLLWRLLRLVFLIGKHKLFNYSITLSIIYIPAAGIVDRGSSLLLALLSLAFVMIRVVIALFIFQFRFGLTSLNTTAMLFISLLPALTCSSLVVIGLRRSLRACRRVARILSGRRWRFYFGALLSSTVWIWFIVADVTNGVLSVCVGKDLHDWLEPVQLVGWERVMFIG